jgi:heme-degrading monooxygenase HmoA
MHTIIWRFVARPAHEEAFIRVYGADGRWTELFRRVPGFIRTELFRNEAAEREFLVLDHWESGVAFDAFKAAHGADYEALDRECEAMTEREEKIAVTDSALS